MGFDKKKGVNKINIAFVTDSDEMMSYLAVKSVIVSADANTSYHFHILISKSFEEKSKNCFYELIGRHEITFYRVKDRFDGVKLQCSWISEVTYYRLLIPDLLLNEDKCLYLDSDVVVSEDLSSLYNTDICNYLLAGVYALAYHLKESNDTYCKKVGLPDTSNYVNAGVLLMNLKKMREQNCTKKMMGLVSANLPSQDQDIINRICYGQIKKLPFRYNVQTKYYKDELSIYSMCYEKEEIEESWRNPAIIHYADWKKPWTYIDCPFADRWWKLCKGSIFEDYYYSKLREAFFYHILYKRDGEDFEKWERNIKTKLYKASVILLYGAGKTASQCMDELLTFGIAVTSVIETEPKSSNASFCGLPIISPKEMTKFHQDALIILAVRDRYHMEIIKTCNSNGFYNIITLKNGKLSF